jgi:hypothetical protein
MQFALCIAVPRTKRVFERNKRSTCGATSQPLTPLEDSLRARLGKTEEKTCGATSQPLTPLEDSLRARLGRIEDAVRTRLGRPA